jgi:hypothetical protein
VKAPEMAVGRRRNAFSITGFGLDLRLPIRCAPSIRRLAPPEESADIEKSQSSLQPARFRQKSCTWLRNYADVWRS